MKQLIMTLLLGGASLGASAQSYEYLTFQKVSGDEFSMAIDHLKITFDQGNLTATDGSKTVSVTLNDMNKMFFTATPTAIDQATTDEATQVAANIVNGQLHVTAPMGSKVCVYDMGGRQVNAQHLTKGTYLVRINNTTLKVLAQ